MSTVIIRRPRRVMREALSDPLNRARLDQQALAHVDSILAKPDEEWTRREFRAMHQYFGDCDD